MAASKARLRHIAISVADVAATQKFFEDAFGMTKAGDAGRGVYMTDGTINVALLDYKGGKIPDMNNDKPLIGTIHFGMWVDDLEKAEAQATARSTSSGVAAGRVAITSSVAGLRSTNESDIPGGYSGPPDRPGRLCSTGADHELHRRLVAAGTGMNGMT